MKHTIFELGHKAQARFVLDVLKLIQKRQWSKKEAELLNDLDAAIEIMGEFYFLVEAQEKEKFIHEPVEDAA